MKSKAIQAKTPTEAEQKLLSVFTEQARTFLRSKTYQKACNFFSKVCHKFGYVAIIDSV